MKRCVVLCRVKFIDDGLKYEHHQTISLGPFDDHESAGEFMTEYLENPDGMMKCLGSFYPFNVTEIVGWEVADLLPSESIARSWSDHERARRGTYSP